MDARVLAGPQVKECLEFAGEVALIGESRFERDLAPWKMWVETASNAVPGDDGDAISLVRP